MFIQATTLTIFMCTVVFHFVSIKLPYYRHFERHKHQKYDERDCLSKHDFNNVDSRHWKWLAYNLSDQPSIWCVYKCLLSKYHEIEKMVQPFGSYSYKLNQIKIYALESGRFRAQ